ncbi:MAG: recombinase [Candidatus Saccharibacteria bacterium]|nr:recombinase [Candidatus Saccharibacteria bacterium]
MKAILIARVSTDDQAEALPAQVYKLQDYALKNEFDFELVEIKESAYKGDRVEFNKVISRLSNITEPIALVFDKVDRYSRDPSSSEVRILNSLCKAGKIELHFISDYLVLTQYSSANQWFMLSLNTSTSQLYSNTISDNVKRRQAQMRRDGLLAGKAPRGYLNAVKDGKKWVDINPLEAQAVKEAFEGYSTGSLTLRQIKALWFEKFNITCAVSHIERVLKNPFYYGFMQVNGNLYEHHYEKIITKELFDACEDNRRGYRSKPKSVGGLPFTYKGLIRCSECGCLVTFETKKQKYTYGHCNQFKYKHDAQYIREKEFTYHYEKTLKKLIVPDDVIKTILELINADKLEARKNVESKTNAIKSEIAKYENRIDRIYEDHLDNKIDDSLYERKTKEYQTSIANLQTQLTTFELSDNTRLETVSHLLEVAKNAHNIFTSADYLGKRKILKKVLSNSELSGRKLLLKLKEPYEMMALCNDNSSWQGYVESNHGFRFWRPTH